MLFLRLHQFRCYGNGKMFPGKLIGTLFGPFGDAKLNIGFPIVVLSNLFQGRNGRNTRHQIMKTFITDYSIYIQTTCSCFLPLLPNPLYPFSTHSYIPARCRTTGTSKRNFESMKRIW